MICATANGTMLATHADRRELFLRAGRLIVEITRRHYEQDDMSVLPRSVVTLSAAGDLGVRAIDGDNKVVFYPIDLVDDTPRGLVLAGIPADARIIVAGQELVTEGDVVDPKEADRATIEKLVGNLADGM